MFLPKFFVFAGPDLSKFPKNSLTKISHFCRCRPVKISENVLNKICSFLQVRTCQNFQKCTLTKISHFCRTGNFGPKFFILQVRTCQNFQKKPKFLQKISKTSLTKISHFLCQVRTCKKMKNFAGQKISKNLNKILTGPDLSKFLKIFDKEFLIFAGPDLSKFPKRTLKKISHFCRSGPVEISENVL